jgi:hypothetical protein
MSPHRAPAEELPINVEPAAAAPSEPIGYLAAYLDVMGLRAELSQLDQTSWWQSNHNSDASLNAILDKVCGLRALFRQFWAGYMKPSPVQKKFLQSNPTEEQLATWRAAQVPPLNITHYGDAMLVAAPFEMTQESIPFPAVLAFFGATAHAMLRSLAEARAIRVGIAIGPCIIDPDTNGVFGTAVSTAVELEQKADWPRIIVSQSIVDILRSTASAEAPVGHPQHVNAKFARKCLSLVTADIDQHFILDYLNAATTSLIRTPDTIKRAASEFVATESAKVGHSPKVREKYERVRAYFAAHGVA